MMMNESKMNLEALTIGTLPVGCLTTAAFRIPPYQRGYRWKKDDVEKLLNDLKAFLESTQDHRPFYCLQPLVVTKSKDHPSEWEVVDGQQRLTTLFLIWKVINESPPYDLSYDTRDRSKFFLKKISEKTPSDITNIDFHHIYHAHQSIQEWFNDDSDLKKCFNHLLTDTDTEGRNVRFIWYQLGPDDDAVAAFTRLNVGKIPLTDEELIRALFLRSRQAGKPAAAAFQHRMALEWDRIESALQESDFWGFISNQPAPEGGRIRLLFELCAPKLSDTKTHALFTHYEELLKKSDSISLESEWQQIVSAFEQLDEWNRDSELFHLVGFLNAILRKKSSIEELRKLIESAKDFSKSDFSAHLRSRIRKGLIKNGKKVAEFVGELDYEENQSAIRPTLALFNIATVIRTRGVQMRFPFHLYHDTKVGWDIEHVQSKSGDGLKNFEQQKAWLESCKPELQVEDDFQLPSGSPLNKSDESSACTLLAKLELFINENSNEKFEELEEAIRTRLGEKKATDSKIHSIGNLTLLDAPTNRGYGNAPFVVKRAEILKPERPEGTFILPCTRDLFLKVFSKKPGNLRQWDIDQDGAAHEAAIRQTLETFFSEQGGNSQ
jgi:hypothetical protein